MKAAQWLTGSLFLLLTTHKGPDGGRVLGSGSGSSGRRQPHTDTQGAPGKLGGGAHPKDWLRRKGLAGSRKSEETEEAPKPVLLVSQEYLAAGASGRRGRGGLSVLLFLGKPPVVRA